MCFVSEPTLQNLVVHVRLPREESTRELLLGTPAAAASARDSREGRRRRSNFYVLRPDGGCGGERRPAKKRGVRRGLSFTVFPKGCSVIVTGLSHPDEVVPALRRLAEIVGAPAGEIARWERRTVNSTHTGSVVCSDGRTSIREALDRLRRGAAPDDDDDASAASISFRTQFFPGILLRWGDLRGSANLFDNGRYILVGTRREGETRRLYERLCALTRDNWTTLLPGTPCVWTAASS
jgi:hypothetical protein